MSWKVSSVVYDGNPGRDRTYVCLQENKMSGRKIVVEKLGDVRGKGVSVSLDEIGEEIAGIASVGETWG